MSVLRIHIQVHGEMTYRCEAKYPCKSLLIPKRMTTFAIQSFVDYHKESVFAKRGGSDAPSLLSYNKPSVT